MNNVLITISCKLQKRWINCLDLMRILFTVLYTMQCNTNHNAISSNKIYFYVFCIEIKLFIRIYLTTVIRQ